MKIGASPFSAASLFTQDWSTLNGPKHDDFGLPQDSYKKSKKGDTKSPLLKCWRLRGIYYHLFAFYQEIVMVLVVMGVLKVALFPPMFGGWSRLYTDILHDYFFKVVETTNQRCERHRQLLRVFLWVRGRAYRTKWNNSSNDIISWIILDIKGYLFLSWQDFGALQAIEFTLVGICSSGVFVGWTFLWTASRSLEDQNSWKKR